MALAFQQQIFALDAKYNAHRAPNFPNFRTLYIRRRNQLLRENAKFKDIETINQYLNIRMQLLQRKYGSPNDNLSSPANVSKQRSKNRTTNDPSSKNQSSRNTELSVSQNYAFSGVHHIFDQHTEPVTILKFANNDRSRLCCGSDDGSLSICDVTAKPPQVSFVLRGHSRAVTGCDWSASNDLLVSSSRDGTLCLWNVGTQKYLRKVFDQFSTEILCCTFQPANNNMVIAGNARGMVQVLNISTGIYPKGGSSVLGGRVKSIVCDSSGRLFWAGNDKGLIISYNCDIVTGRLSKMRRMFVGGSISCLSWSPWVCRHPAVLLNCTDNSVNLFRVVDKEGGLVLKRKFNNLHSTHTVRSTFCPIMSFRKGICVVTGSEDSCVYFLDIESNIDHPVINKLQGHAAPVLGVSFNYDESFLASSDLQGLVIIWRRS